MEDLYRRQRRGAFGVALLVLTLLGPIAAEGQQEAVTSATFSCQPASPADFYQGLIAMPPDWMQVETAGFSMTVSVDQAAGTVTFNAEGSASAADPREGMIGSRDSTFTATGSGAFFPDWGFLASGTAVDTVVVHPQETTHIPYPSTARLVGLVGDDGASMALCWRSDGHPLESLDTFLGAGISGLVNLCGGGFSFPGAFLCSVSGNPMTRAQPAATTVPGTAMTADPVTSTTAGESESGTSVADAAAASSTVPVAPDGASADDPTEVGWGGLLLWVALAFGVGAAGVLLWVILRRPIINYRKMLTLRALRHGDQLEDLVDVGVDVLRPRPPAPPPATPEPRRRRVALQDAELVTRTPSGVTGTRRFLPDGEYWIGPTDASHVRPVFDQLGRQLGFIDDRLVGGVEFLPEPPLPPPN